MERYLGCMSQALGKESSTFSEVLGCAKAFWSEIEPVLTNVHGEVEKERIKFMVTSLGPSEKEHLTREQLEAVSHLIEIFLGGIDLTQVNFYLISNLESLYRLLVEEGVLSEGRQKLWYRIISELKSRFEKNIISVEEGSATPLLAIGLNDIPWALSYLWPFFVEQVTGSGVRSFLENVNEKIEGGYAILFTGTDGSGRLGIMYLSLRNLLENGYMVYAGDPRFSVRLTGEKVVFSPREHIISPAGENKGVVEVNVAGHFTRDELEEVARKIASWEGISVSESTIKEIIEHSHGSPGFIEAALLYISLSMIYNKTYDVPSSPEKLKAGIRSLVPPKLQEKLSLIASLGSRCFPTELLDMEEGEEEIVNRLLLKYDPLGLYSWRSLISREAFRRQIVIPFNPYETIFYSESPFHATWSLLVGTPSIARYIAVRALNQLYEENSYPILEAVAILSPGSIARLLKTTTTYRMQVLSESALTAGSLAVAEELLSLSTHVLERLKVGEFDEEFDSLKVRLAEIQVRRILPEEAIKTLSDISPRSEELRFKKNKILGASYIGVNEFWRALSILNDALNYAQEKNLKNEVYFLRILTIDAYIGMNRVEEAKEEAEKLVKELTRAECSLAELLFEAAMREKQLKNKTNYAVCASLTRCGYPELAGAYGCFS